MARIPPPVRGLIFRYGYVWLSEHRRGRFDPTKDRPACIAMHVTDKGDLKVVDDAGTDPGDVIILPITTKEPGPREYAVEITPDEKRLCGLDPADRSWIVVSEYNADTWPNADLSTLPGTDRIAYGIAPPSLMRRVGKTFDQALRAGKVIGVKRS